MQESTPLAIEWRELARVLPYEANPRNITDAAIDKVAASLKAFGWRQPIVIDQDDVIIAGHTRRLAAIRLKIDRVPVHVASGLSAEAARAYRLADNRTGEEATWNTEVLQAEIAALRELDFDIAPLGFDVAELDDPSGPEDPPANTYAQQFGVIVLCASEEEQRGVYERLKDQGFELKVVTT